MTCIPTFRATVPPRPASSDAAPTAAADKPGDNGTPLPQVDALRKQLDAIPLKLGEPDDGRKLLADINAIGQAAERVVSHRGTELAEIDRRLEGLGPAPGSGGPAPDAVRADIPQV